ncbi:VWA-like domain-containing protein [Nonomuraea jabiensis]|uniref:VWA-like domain-containing protein n=1 Tax=Nonomuraea jabiensis TaxID=882448 RepID=UPI0036814D85
MSSQSAVREAVAVAVAANLPVILWGAPGTGKTSSVLALGARLGLPVEVVVGSIREPSDFSGLPVLRDGGTWFAPPRWAERLAEAGHGLLFLDELTTAPPAVQAAMLRVVLERTVGDLTLPDEVRIVAAANPPDQAADGWDLSAPLANRLIHLHWQVEAAGRVDFSYRRPSRRAGAHPEIVVPAMVSPVPAVAVVIDTSGSVTEPRLDQLLTELTGILNGVAGPNRRLRVICCDVAAHPVQEVRRAADVRLTGGGGTDMRAGLAAATALRPRPDLVIVLTDGQTPWPERRVAAEVVVCLIGEDGHAPEWAAAVRVPKEDRS